MWKLTVAEATALWKVRYWSPGALTGGVVHCADASRAVAVERRERDRDNRHRVSQTEHEEHARLQHRHQFRLAGRAFQELAAEDTDTHTSTQRTQTDHDTGSQGRRQRRTHRPGCDL